MYVTTNAIIPGNTLQLISTTIHPMVLITAMISVNFSGIVTDRNYGITVLSYK